MAASDSTLAFNGPPTLHADTLSEWSFTTNQQGQTVVSAFPALTFACRKDAERFCARIAQAKRQRGK